MRYLYKKCRSKTSLYFILFIKFICTNNKRLPHKPTPLNCKLGFGN